MQTLNEQAASGESQDGQEGLVGDESQMAEAWRMERGPWLCPVVRIDV